MMYSTEQMARIVRLPWVESVSATGVVTTKEKSLTVQVKEATRTVNYYLPSYQIDMKLQRSDIYVAYLHLTKDPGVPKFRLTPQSGCPIRQDEWNVPHRRCVGTMHNQFYNLKDPVDRLVLFSEFLQTAVPEGGSTRSRQTYVRLLKLIPTN